MSLYAEYILEREGKSTLEHEGGFMTHSRGKDDVGRFCYIENVYIKPALRKSGIAKKMADKISFDAKVDGCQFLYGSVTMSTNGSVESIKVLDAYGMKYSHVSGETIYFIKEL